MVSRALITCVLCVAAVPGIAEFNVEDAARALTTYYEAMCVPKAFPLLEGDARKERHNALRERILADVALAPLPERIDLDTHRSTPIDHPWCTIEKIQYQLWPGVYTEALLFMPKEFPELPAPAALCPHGHWDHGYAWPEVQKRMLVLAKMGYVTLSPHQNHHEDLPLGLSHQTLMIWTNMRGIDFLQSLPEVDPERIGAAGASGGGLQTQMIAALDKRIKAATIVGLTCDFREIMFPHAAHCACNHWPNAMTHTDLPEISALAFPRPVQYLVMNDWTRHFPHDNFVAIQELYRLNRVPERVSCTYWPTDHVFDREKRERTYWWMERWLRHGGDHHTPIPPEPDDIITITPPEELYTWPVDNPSNQGFNALSALFREQYHHARMGPIDPSNAAQRHGEMRALLPDLLGLGHELPPLRENTTESTSLREEDGSIIRLLIPSERELHIPTVIIKPDEKKDGPWPVLICLGNKGSTDDLVEAARVKSREGTLVVIPDIRFTGVYDLQSLAGIIGPDLVTHPIASNHSGYTTREEQRRHLLWAWERNSIVWGRPIAGMAVTDIQHVIRSLETETDADLSSITIETRGPGFLALAALFAAILDPRIHALDLDFNNSRFEFYRSWHENDEAFPVIPFILRHGDVPEWLAVLSDRTVIVRNLQRNSRERDWLHHIFALSDNPGSLTMHD